VRVVELVRVKTSGYLNQAIVGNAIAGARDANSEGYRSTPAVFREPGFIISTWCVRPGITGTRIESVIAGAPKKL
jgi:hypothetical protein